MLRIGTDCSGIEAPIQALNNLNIDHEHVFSCEIDKYARQSINANYKPKILFEDMTQDRKLPKIDLYVCGFPCQPFSLSGNRLGSKDKRGNIFLHCIETIKNTCTKVFILENVRGITSIEKGEYWKYIVNTLENLKNYNVYSKVLNTKDYGIPQNRERLFIIGIMKSKMSQELNVPVHEKCENIETFVDYSDKTKMSFPAYQLKKEHQFKNTVFCNIEALRPHNKTILSPKICNTITCKGVWCIKMGRIANTKEHLLLQGFPKNFKQVVSDNQMRKQIGNSMSVNVLICLLRECFKCVEI